MRQYFQLGGVGVECRIEKQYLAGRVAAVMQYFGAAPKVEACEDAVLLGISDDDQFTPPHGARILGGQKQIAVFESGEDLLISDGTSSALVSADAGHADVRLKTSPSAGATVDGSDLLVITMSVMMLLRQRGLFGLHGACLERNGRGWLFIGDSDTGKSTLSYTLLQAGWKYLTDDSMLISQRHNSDVYMHPLRRDFCMDAEAADLFPEISRNWFAQPSDHAKRVISVDEIFGDRHVKECVPRFLIFPTIVSAATSILRPLSRKEAVLRLMRQSAFLGLSSAFMTEQMEMLKALAGQTTAFELLAAPDIKGNPSRAASLLEKGVEIGYFEGIETE